MKPNVLLTKDYLDSIFIDRFYSKLQNYIPKVKTDFWGLYTICWRFWSWKTFFTHISISNLSKKTWWVLITNYYSKDSDLVFSGHDDFTFLLRFLLEYKLKDYEKQRIPFFIVLDESSLYFWNRSSIFSEEHRDLIVQLRKMNTTICLIIQEPPMLDKVFRTLCCDYIHYHNWWRDPLSFSHRIGLSDWLVSKKQYYIISEAEFDWFESKEPEKSWLKFWPKYYKYTNQLPSYETYEFIRSKSNLYDEDFVSKLNKLFFLDVKYEKSKIVSFIKSK